MGIIFSRTQRRASTGSLPQMVGTRRQDFDEGEACAIALDLQRLADRPSRFHDVLVVGKGYAFDVGWGIEGGEKLRYMDREAFIRGAPAPGRRGALLPDQGGGGHLSARHAVDSVVHEKDCDLLTAVGGMHDFSGANGREIAVSLIGNDDFVGMGSLDSGGRSGRAAVRGLDIAYVEIIVGKYRATHWTHEDRLVLQTEFLQGFGNQLVGDAVSAAGTVVGLVLEFGFAVVEVVEQRRLGVNELVAVVVTGTTSLFGLCFNFQFDFTSGSATLIPRSFAIFVVLFEPALGLALSG